MTNKEWLAGVLKKYNYRPEAISEILAHCDVVILDPDSTAGGGVVNYTPNPQYWEMVLHTKQEEAAVHEAAHVWWFIYQNDEKVAYIIDQYFIQAGLLHKPRFKLARQACWDGVFGPPNGMGVYWADYAGRYDDREMFAGMASLIMGNVRLLPHSLRKLFEEMFLPIQSIYLPIIFS